MGRLFFLRGVSSKGGGKSFMLGLLQGEGVSTLHFQLWGHLTPDLPAEMNTPQGRARRKARSLCGVTHTNHT